MSFGAAEWVAISSLFPEDDLRFEGRAKTLVILFNFHNVLTLAPALLCWTSSLAAPFPDTF